MTSGLYIHVPFCSSRCGYCDFNTYTPAELAADPASMGSAQGRTPEGYLDALERELEMAAVAWDRTGLDPVGSAGVSTVFFGGGTPSMLGSAGLNRALRAVRNTVGLAEGAEVTTEVNPESTSPEFFDSLLEGGFNRISLGMQSAAGHVLKVLERQHTPGRPEQAVREAHAAGFEHVNLDLIYGTPTETDDDLARSLDAVIGAEVDHVSAYSLIVEDGTAMARKVRKGQLPAPDEDVYADRYEMIDQRLVEAGFDWYEVSNWAKPGGECEHNLIYWRGGQWWGAGPGAHGCVRLAPGVTTAQVSSDATPSGLTRTINAKHPARYWDAVFTDEKLPVVTFEPLSEADLRTERVLLGLRLRDGIALADVDAEVNPAVTSELERYVSMGLLAVDRATGRVRVTHEGRYLVDGIATDLLIAMDDE